LDDQTLLVVPIAIAIGIFCAALGRKYRIVHDIMPITANAIMMVAMLVGSPVTVAAAVLGLVCLLICAAAREWTPARAHRALTMFVLIPLLFVDTAASASPRSHQMSGHGTAGTLPVGLVVVAYVLLSTGVAAWIVWQAAHAGTKSRIGRCVTEIGELAASIICITVMS
jgi:hypothetical protein